MKNKVHTGYRLVSDDDGHHYVIPANEEKAWDEWVYSEKEDENSWDPPEWADSIGCSPQNVIFDYYYVEGRDEKPTNF